MEHFNSIARIFSPELALRQIQRDWLDRRRFLIGDLHNHCGISYGHGTLADAIGFAHQQLDFFSVTGHFAWPDMTDSGGVGVPAKVAAYHREGFARLREGWERYRWQMTESDSQPNSSIAFLSYEFHSFSMGDYTVIVKDPKAELPAEPDQNQSDVRLERLLATCDSSRDGIICMPHHIGYKEGFRGISWRHFSPNASPVVEIVSMHGSAESHRTSINYLHTMGPRTAGNTMQGGLAAGYVFGVTGSTDHHNASPGSYGCGRTGVWSMGKDRDRIWQSLCARTTCALTGDPIEAALFIDDAPIGAMAENGFAALTPSDSQAAYRTVDAYLVGCDALERVEILQNNRVIARLFPADVLDEQPLTDTPAGFVRTGRIGFAFGWGEKQVSCHWQITVSVLGGTLDTANPRLRGQDIVDPLDKPLEDDSQASSSHHARFASDLQSNTAFLQAITTGNPTATTNTTQGFSLEITGTRETRIHLDIKAELKGNTVNRIYSYALSELFENPLSEYVDGFVSPAFFISRFIPLQAYSASYHAKVLEPHSLTGRPFYYLRAFQTNGDSIWTSAIWPSVPIRA